VSQEAKDDLRTTAETTKRDAERLAAIEAEKLEHAPEDPRTAELATEAAQLSERLVTETRYEQALADELSTGEGAE
jgi:hypothetical protein